MNVGSTSDAAGAGGGLAALMVAANPNLTPEQIKAAMIAGTDEVASMEGELVSNVRHKTPYTSCTFCHACRHTALQRSVEGLLEAAVVSEPC